MPFKYEDLNITDVMGWTFVAAMVLGGVIPYIPQYRQIKRKDDTQGFSLYVCLTLLIANILRIFFWFGSYYELPLLCQSIIMIITMLMMIKLCTDVRNKNTIIKSRARVFTDLDPKYFWQWTDFQSYLEFVLLFAVVGGVFTYMFVNNWYFTESIGLAAVMTEAMLGVPQFLQNLTNKSTEGMSKAMVLMWTLGDVYKTIYFVWRESPIQFQICGILQVVIDLMILLQVYIYQTNTPPPRAPMIRAD